MPTDTAIFSNKEFEAYKSCLERLELEPSDDVLVADLGEKKLYHLKKGLLQATYVVSSSARPRSCKENSLGTPWGLHEISARHGDGEPSGMVFVGRVATGTRWQDMSADKIEGKCLVTTRILRLGGLEDGLNRGAGIDSHGRYIYIHGTNFPERLPANISAGCLVMADDALISLFESVNEGTHVWISHP